MIRKISGPNQLQWFAGITATALIGIIFLQAYWLHTAYRQQQDRFKADTENAMLATLIKSQVHAELASMGNLSLQKEVIDTLTDFLTVLLSKELPYLSRPSVDTAAHMLPGRSPSLYQATTSTAETMALRPPPQAEQNETAHSGLPAAIAFKNELDFLKKTLASELRKRAINIPVALAVVDAGGRPLTATVAIDQFQKIPVKSAVTDAIAWVQSKNVRLQAAFPDANLFLLRRMAWTLTAALLLILSGIVSFTLLLRLFFRQKRLADMRNDFMNNMTHELKTPISAVSIALELVQDKRHPINETARQEYLDMARGELQRLDMLVEKVLKIAAFKKSEIRLAPESFPAIPWLQQVISSLKPVWETTETQLRTLVQPNDLLLRADKMHLTNVLQNLLENAVKYNDKPVPQINIHVAAASAATLLTISDNGRGIPEAYLPNLFDKFFRVPMGDRHDIKGYGLGLSYVKAIVDLHGGTITVDSTPGKGTTFRLSLPAA